MRSFFLWCWRSSWWSCLTPRQTLLLPGWCSFTDFPKEPQPQRLTPCAHQCQKAFIREQKLSLLKCLKREHFRLWVQKGLKKKNLIQKPEGLGVFWEWEQRQSVRGRMLKTTTSHGTETNLNLLQISPTSLHLWYLIYPKHKKLKEGQERNGSSQGILRTKTIPREFCKFPK